MLMSMAYLDHILLVSSTVEAVDVARRASTWSWFAKNLPTDVASPCVHCFREAGSCVSVQHAYFAFTRMRISRDAHDAPPRVQHFSAFHLHLCQDLPRNGKCECTI